jgi:hypothetical protein
MNASPAPGDPEAQHAAAASRFTQTTATPALLYAMRYAALGWPSFPCRADAKVPILNGGFRNATTNEAILESYWRECPRANVGLPTGPAFWVLDVDPRHGGNAALEVLQERYGPLPDTLRARTPSGGEHWYFAADSRARNTASALGLGLDTRGHGGYVLAEGSTVGGSKYQFLDWDPLEDEPAPLAPAPEWLIELAFHSRGDESERRVDGKIPSGQRNSTLSRAAYGMRKSGLAIPAIEAALLEQNRLCCDPPLGEAEVRAIARGKVGIEPDKRTTTAEGGPLGVDITEFVADYVPPDGVVDGIVQRGYVHGVISLTNHGKTAIGTTMILTVATGQRFAGHEVEQGLVYVLCGENPFDFKGRLIAAMQELGIDPTAAKGRIRVVGQAFPLTAQIERLKNEIRAWGNVVLVFVDTSVAYFSGDDEDSNVEARAHAQTLREFTLLPSRPAVVVACHPVKNATRDNLVPRGGSAFLNEIDANLTVWAEDEVATLHWHRKIRGTPFEPVQFRLVRKVIDGPTNAKGQPGTAGVAVPIAERDAEALAKRDWHDENRLLDAMLRHPKESIAGWALACAWTVGAESKAHKSKVARLLEKLASDKLVKRYRGRWVLTSAGKKEAAKNA